MRLQLIVVLILVACVKVAAADDQTTPQAKARTSSSGTSTTSDTAKAPPAVIRGPVRPSANPNVRPVNPNAIYRYSPANRSWTIAPTYPPGRTTVTGRRGVTPNQRPDVAVNNAGRANHVRLPSRTGNELTFAQAQAQCSRHRHDRDWWRNHHTRICFYGGGYWFWNAGWWFPAWGYSPYYNNYVYDGPILGYGELSPGDVTAQVQEALAQQGYYYGAIDGVLGPETRDAILRFQADHGLATTAAIDEATLDTLGLT